MGVRRERVLLCIGTLTSFFATPSPKETWLFGGRTMVMPHQVSRPFQARRALLRYQAPRYQQASPAQKTLLLDSFVEWTGYTRKYAIALLNHGKYDQQTIQRRRLPQYRPSVQQALFQAWKAAHYVCAKRLLPFLPNLVALLEVQGCLELTEEERRQLLAISLSTAERFLRTQRKTGLHGLSTTTPCTRCKSHIPVRTFSQWEEDHPGFVEMERARSLWGAPRWEVSLHSDADRSRYRLDRMHPAVGEKC
jgi:hypothetical protein